MADTPGAIGRRYLPFLAVAAVQVLLVAVAPSRGLLGGSKASTVAAGGQTTAGDATTAADAGAGAASSGAAGSSAAGGSAAGAGASGGTAGGSASVAAGAVGAKAAGPAAQDLSKCDKSGKEIGAPGYTGMPPCVPVWHGGDNSSTLQGVTATEIHYTVYVAQGNQEVNSILATQGLAATAQQSCDAKQAFNDEINKRYETYGRKFVPMDGPGANSGKAQPNQGSCTYPYFQGQCMLSPPDPPCERAEAKTIVAMHPAFVLAGVADPAFYDELTKDGVIVIDGGANPESYYDQVANYRWGILMDGSRQASFDSEYWCKRMVGKAAAHAGPDVQTTRNWGATPGAVPARKLAVLYPENYGDETTKLSVDNFKAQITGKTCNTPGGVLEISYASDINTAQQQATNIVQQLIQNHITTVACWCDPIAPVFLTQNMKNQGYFPENWILGVGLIDYDVLGRLYDPSEWQYAFGVSDLAVSTAFTQSGAQLWWNDVGRSGSPDATENATLPFYSLMASGVQMAGPHLSVASVAAGLHNLPTTGGWAASGHDATAYLVGFKSPSPYTATEDVREVNWSATRNSEVDGKPGAYCPIDHGHRYNLGEWPAGDPDVFDTAHNGC